MGKKTKLTTEQKKYYDQLKKFKEGGLYFGDQDLKELALDGKFAVLSLGSPVFETITCTDDEENARQIMQWNYRSHSRIVDLKTGDTVTEMNRLWFPQLDIEKYFKK